MRHPLTIFIRPFLHCCVALAFVLLAGCGGGKEAETVEDPGPRTTIDREDSRIRMGIALLSEGHLDAAMEQFHRLAEDPQHQVTPGNQPEWLDDLLRQLIRRRQIAPADSLLRATGPLESRSPELRYLSANLLVIQGRETEALDAYENLGELVDPALQLRAHHERASLHMVRGEMEEALTAAREGLSLEPEHAALHILVAQALNRQGRPRAALDQLATLPRSTSRWLTEGEIRLESLDQTDSAVVALEKAYQAAPQIPNVRYLLGRAYVKAERPRPAMMLLEGLASRPDPFEQSRSLLAEAYRQIGRSASADSLEAVDKAYRRGEELKRLRTEGLQASVAGELDTALARFDAALKMEAGSADLHNDRGAVLARMERWKDAERAFRRAEKLAPTDPTVQQNLARLYERTGDTAARDAAIARYQELVGAGSGP